MREQRAALRWYRASVVHANWNPIPRRFKDYIALPKACVERAPDRLHGCRGSNRHGAISDGWLVYYCCVQASLALKGDGFDLTWWIAGGDRGHNCLRRARSGGGSGGLR